MTIKLGSRPIMFCLEQGGQNFIVDLLVVLRQLSKVQVGLLESSIRWLYVDMFRKILYNI